MRIGPSPTVTSIDYFPRLDGEPDDVALKRLRRLERRVEGFERASGVRISREWTGVKIGEAVAFVMRGGLEAERRKLEELRDRHQDASAIIEAALAQSE